MWKKCMTINFLSPFEKCIPTKIPCQTISALEIEYTFFNQRKKMNVKEVYDYQFLSTFKNCFPTKIPCQIILVFDFEYTFFDQRKEIFVKKDYQFLSVFKKCIPTPIYMPKILSVWKFLPFFNQRKKIYGKTKYDYHSFLAKQFQCLNLNTLFQSKEGNVRERRPSVFVTFHKKVPRQVLPCQKFQCLKLITLFSIKGRKCCEISVWLSFFVTFQKKCIPTKTPIQTISMFEFDYTFFNQRKELFKKEGYQFLSPFIKM